jgi:hypothetical protein
MIRTQIQLTEEQARKLRRRARQEGLSLSEMIRRCVDRGLQEGTTDRPELYGRAAVLVGAFPDREGRTDLASRHDDYLDEAFR